MLARKSATILEAPTGAEAGLPAEGEQARGERSAAVVSRSVTAAGLLAFDERLASLTASSIVGGGALVVATAEPEALAAIATHAARVLSAAGWASEVSVAHGGIEGFVLAAHREVPGTQDRARSPRDVAAAILERAAERVQIIVDALPGRFSRAVAHELSSMAGERGRAVIWIATEAPPVLSPVRVASLLSDAERERWWAVASRGHLPAAAPIDALDRWLGASAVTSARSLADVLTGVSPAARAAFARLAWVGRPADDALLARVGATASIIDELVTAALAHRTPAGVALRVAPPLSGAPLDGEDALAVARALLDDASATSNAASPMASAWSGVRAAELAFGARDAALAERGLRSAFACPLDPDARGDLVSRLVDAAAASLGAPEPQLLHVALDLFDASLRHGEVEPAARLGRALVGVAPSDARCLLAHGRALAAQGDLTSAAHVLGRAAAIAPDAGRPAAGASLLARATVELGEARYASGDVAGARTAAEEAISRVGSLDAVHVTREHADIRLAARNLLGKLLLAGAEYAAAESHFVADTLDAQLEGLPLAELRARVNRAIAVLSLGRRADARRMLDAVLDEAERAGELRALAMAVTNLATIAILDHRYADALELGERAVDVLRRTGEKPRLVRAIANLAQLRLWLGLEREAADVLRFAHAAMRGALPPAQAAHLSLVGARIRFAQGDTAGAWRLVNETLDALGTAGSSGPIAQLVSGALRLGARLALEDGDLPRAESLLERAERERAPERARAELALLAALVERAAGRDHVAAARAALEAGRSVDDDELIREASVVAGRAVLDAGDVAEARQILRAAISRRDRVVGSLPEDLRERFLARREVGELLTLESAIASATEGRASAPPASASPASVTPVTLRGAGPASASGSSSADRSGIVGADPGVKSLLVAIGKVGAADTTVLVHGESGTGKELVAEALHRASRRRSGPLVKVNCAALVETLLLSELFGHEKGAFTGAAGRRRGRFEMAEGGTLFLDEIGDISPRTQVALLRVLQEKTFERVGGTAPIRADVRIVCATHRNLPALVAQGLFREDLYYRLCGVVLEVPALRSRLGDLPAIADALLDRISAERGTPKRPLSARALSGLRQHAWPGNVRELENALRAASLFAEGEALELEDFAQNVEGLRHLLAAEERLSAPPGAPAEPPGTPAAAASSVLGTPSVSSRDASAPPSSTAGVVAAAYAEVRSGTSLHDMKRAVERECIGRALGESGGNITKAAQLLGMKRPRLSQLVKQYQFGADGLSPEGDAESDDTGTEDD